MYVQHIARPWLGNIVLCDIKCQHIKKYFGMHNKSQLLQGTCEHITQEKHMLWVKCYISIEYMSLFLTGRNCRADKARPKVDLQIPVPYVISKGPIFSFIINYKFIINGDELVYQYNSYGNVSSLQLIFKPFMISGWFRWKYSDQWNPNSF